MSDSEFKTFMDKCRELGFPDDARMDDYLEFLDAFTLEVREQAEQEIREEIGHDFQYNRRPEPSEDEREERVTERTHERLRSCAQKLAKLEEGLVRLEGDPASFTPFNPENGWGSYDVLVQFVRGYLDACRQHPGAAVRTWR